MPGRQPKYSVNCSILFTELPLLERPAAARAAGFDAVEFWWPFAAAVPADDEVAAFEQAVIDAGVQLTGLNLFAGDMAGGDRGTLSWPSRAAEFRDNIAIAMGVAERLGCRALNALYGNRVDEATPEEQDALALDNLVLAAAAAKEIGATILLEPLSGVERYPLLSAEDVVAVVEAARERTGDDTVTMLADLYHLAANGHDPSAAIAKFAHLIGHVQIADLPGRNEPGTGQLPIERYLSELAAAGYDTWIGLEYRPSGTTVDSFAWLPPDERGA